VLVCLWQAISNAYGIHADGAKQSAIMQINDLMNKTSTIGYVLA
jgi:hypothetical protein